MGQLMEFVDEMMEFERLVFAPPRRKTLRRGFPDQIPQGKLKEEERRDAIHGASAEISF